MELHSIRHKARKPYQCERCDGAIKTGEVYVRAPKPGSSVKAAKPFHQDCYKAYFVAATQIAEGQ